MRQDINSEKHIEPTGLEEFNQQKHKKKKKLSVSPIANKQPQKFKKSTAEWVNEYDFGVLFIYLLLLQDYLDERIWLVKVEGG